MSSAKWSSLTFFVLAAASIGCEQNPQSPLAPQATPNATSEVATDTQSALVPAASPNAAMPPAGPQTELPIEAVSSDESVEFDGTAAELLTKYDADSAAFQGSYHRKVVLIRGTVDNVWMDRDDIVYLSLAVPDKPSVKCKSADKEIWHVVTPGQDVTLKARCVAERTEPPSVILAHAVVVESGQPTIETVSAADLIRAFFSDPDTARTRYLNRFLIVSGHCCGTGPVFGRYPCSIGLQGPENSQIYCEIGFGKAQIEMTQIPLGSPVLVLGRVKEYVPDKLQVILADSLRMPLEPKP